MNLQKYYHVIIVLFLVIPSFCITQPKKVEKKENTTERTIALRYENEDLVNVINFIAAEKEVNVVLPQGPNTITAKLTFKLDKRVTINEAWNLLKTILDVAGFSLIPKTNLYVITNTTPQISREPMPIFIGISPEDLPSTDQRIRYVYYLSNIKVPTTEEEANSELARLFKGLMAPGYVFKTDTATNAIIVAGESQDIKAVMRIVLELDKAGFQEKMEIVHLHHTQANIVANLFMQQILRPKQVSRYRLDARKQAETYFSKLTKIIPEPRTNSLIILGRAQAVDRIKDFINEYIDVELDSGKSILHIKKLQYRDAQQVVEVIKKILESGRSAVAEQARTEGGPVSGPERFFEEVKVFADTPAEEAAAAEEGEAEPVYKYKGGNNIIVAARNDDWKRIKKLINDLDNPQPQVLIEVLIADLNIGDEKKIGSQTRKPDKISLPGEIEPQFANLQQSMGDNTSNPKSIDADLLRVAYNNGSYVQPGSTDTPNQTIATLAQEGSTLISFNDNDGRTWSILQVLNNLDYKKILSHPHIISTNNQEASIKIGQYRLVTGGVQTAEATATVKNEPIEANLEIKITPRVSEGKIVNLTVKIDISQFIDNTANTENNTRETRTIVTNANVKDGDILALGGLMSSTDEHGLKETPILSRVPILGWFFKNRTASITKTNLTVFISPMIIQPRLRSGISEFTKDYIGVARQYSKEGTLFETLKEPITRWFFKTGANIDKAIDEFIVKDELQTNKKEEEIKKIHKEHLEMEKQEAEKAAEDESTILQQAQGERLGTNKKKKIKEKELEKLNNFAQFEQLSLNKHIPPKTAVPEPVKGWQTKNKIEKKAKKIKPVTTKLESKRAQNNTFLVTLDKQKRSQALQKLINKEDENPLLKVAQINPVRYLQS